jgi:hypothetical protein
VRSNLLKLPGPVGFAGGAGHALTSRSVRGGLGVFRFFSEAMHLGSFGSTVCISSAYLVPGTVVFNGHP